MKINKCPRCGNPSYTIDPGHPRGVRQCGLDQCGEFYEVEDAVSTAPNNTEELYAEIHVLKTKLKATREALLALARGI